MRTHSIEHLSTDQLAMKTSVLNLESTKTSLLSPNKARRNARLEASSISDD